MKLHESTLNRILRDKLIAVVRLDDAEQAHTIIEAIAAGGITTIEITLTTPGAPELIEEFAGRDDLLIGAGTVLDAESAWRVIEAGARFYASPIFDPELIRVAREAGTVSMPGAYTPTEIVSAWHLGGDIIKIFPMPSDGVKFLESLRAPLPQVRLAPSGGVTSDTAAKLLKAGAAALNVGTWLTHEPGGEPGTFERIRERAATLVKTV